MNALRFSILFSTILSTLLHADNFVHPGVPVLDRPTLVSLGIQMPVTGDDNYNATVTVQYRKTGDSVWKQALPLFRVHPDTTLPYVIAPQFAGSILDLRPGTTYDIQLHLIDPDGPFDQVFVLTGTTRTVPGDPVSPRIVNAGNVASLNTALVNAQPGDIITLANGTYSGNFFALYRSGTPANPIVLRGASQDGVIIDGGNCTGCNVFELYGSFIHIENMTVQNAERAIKFAAPSTQSNVVRRVHTKNTTLGITTRERELDYYIADNILEGRLIWPAIYTDDNGLHGADDGINVAGFGNVVAHNRISGFGKAIITEENGDRSVDYYGNDVLWSYDAAMKFAFLEGNGRIMRNRLTNVYMGVSLQPVAGGPVYVYRNVASNVVNEQFKMHPHANPINEPNGIFIFNNTFVDDTAALILETAPNHAYHFAIENNLFIGPLNPQAGTPYAGTTVDWYSYIVDGLFDYNGYWPDGKFGYLLPSKYLQVPSFAALQAAGAGIEVHGLLVTPQTLASGVIGQADYRKATAPSDFTLAVNSPALNRGLVIPNISDQYTGAAPDLGALELGCPTPIYGPRPPGTDETNEPFGCSGPAPPPPAAPTVDSVSPSVGAGSSQTFAFRYSSGTGATYLNTVSARVGTSLNANTSCSINYQAAGNTLTLLNDAGSGPTTTPVTPGGSVVLQNSQCSIDVAKASVTSSGKTLTLTVAVTFKAAFAGMAVLSGYASDKGGMNSGWKALGTWNTAAPPPPSPPTVDAVSPNGGAGTSQTFTFKYSSVNGYAYLNAVNARINGSSNAASSCSVYYQVAGNAMYLLNDAGSTYMGSQVAPGTAVTLQNSQCSIDAAKSSAIGFGKTLTLQLAVTFKPAFAGTETLFGSASDNGGLNSGWQILGTWKTTAPINPAPTADSVNPSTASGAVQMFTFKYSSMNGHGHLNTVYGLINSTLDGSGGCYFYYKAAGNALYLYSDSGTANTGPGAAPGAAVILQNNQCLIDAGKSSVTTSGNTLSLNIAVTIKSTFGGMKTVYGLATDNSTLTSGWRMLGTLTTTFGAWWKPSLRSTWQIQYRGTLDLTPNVDVFEIDGFDRSASDVATIHSKGHKAACYFSAGAYENWRPDIVKFPSTVLGKNVGGWAAERWLDIRRLDILGPIMIARMDMCKSKGFDAVDPDNVDGYTNSTGFPLSYQEQLAYNQFLSKAAHDRGLAIGLKNDLNQVNDLTAAFDFEVDEQCFQYNECNALTPFIKAGKPVFNVEYNLQTAQFCPRALAMQFSSIRKNPALDAFEQVCR